MPCPGLAATRVRIASCRAAAGKKIRRTPVGRTRARRPRRASPRPVEGKIRKRTLTRGSGPHPEMNQDVVCSYEVRAGRDSSGEALQHHRERRIRVGEGEAVPMLEMGLRHMAEGSTCEVVGSSNWAWGPVGLPAAVEGERDIPPDTDVHMLVTLHRCLPQMDGQELPWSEKVSTVTWRKENGNDHFRRREYQKAKRCYMKACEVFGGDYEAPANEVADHVAAGARAKALVADAAANLAAVHLALGDAPHAKEAAEGALVMAPGHVKSLYRLAKACLLMDEFKECEAALRQALQADPENAGVRQVELELRRKRQKYSSKSRRLAEAVVGDLQGGSGEAPAAVAGADSGAAGASAPEEVPAPEVAAPESWLSSLIRSASAAAAEHRNWIVSAAAFVLLVAVMFLLLPRTQARQGLTLLVTVGGSAWSVAVIMRGDEELRRKQL
ncbi:unnamed protein product [Prorocentrum cordatum]|uniref:peptidylprolyl isomerase n=1 Tax=Prorocentrum cordatum TaxID=2364126 RepID=A0ABN9W7W0_9DINO|nr:unnamed protein product [Polarella glacialis]